ncbi:MAG: hypothetical protein M3N21_05680 [Actinomycetota bacterium]|nr:hypothetical protein [Actinomycetota bacterium]
MSFHLLSVAALRDLKPAEKLVLMCLCDNANQKDYLAYPGIPAMMRWANVSRARVFQCLKHLIELKQIEQVKTGHRGQAAEFLLFPFGCCELHGLESNPLDPQPEDKGLADWTDEPCGLSSGLDAIEEKGSTFPPERVYFPGLEGSSLLDPHQVLPPKNIPLQLPPSTPHLPPAAAIRGAHILGGST